MEVFTKTKHICPNRSNNNTKSVIPTNIKLTYFNKTLEFTTETKDV